MVRLRSGSQQKAVRELIVLKSGIKYDENYIADLRGKSQSQVKSKL